MNSMHFPELVQYFSTQHQQVEYVVDPESGFHVVNADPPPPQPPSPLEDDPATAAAAKAASVPLDTAEVAKAKARHKALFKAIAARHRQGAGLQNNRETVAVQQKRQEHANVSAIRKEIKLQSPFPYVVACAMLALLSPKLTGDQFAVAYIFDIYCPCSGPCKKV